MPLMTMPAASAWYTVRLRTDGCFGQYVAAAVLLSGCRERDIVDMCRASTRMCMCPSCLVFDFTPKSRRRATDVQHTQLIPRYIACSLFASNNTTVVVYNSAIYGVSTGVMKPAKRRVLSSCQHEPMSPYVETEYSIDLVAFMLMIHEYVNVEPA